MKNIFFSFRTGGNTSHKQNRGDTESENKRQETSPSHNNNRKCGNANVKLQH